MYKSVVMDCQLASFAEVKVKSFVSLLFPNLLALIRVPVFQIANPKDRKEIRVCMMGRMNIRSRKRKKIENERDYLAKINRGGRAERMGKSTAESGEVFQKAGSCVHEVGECIVGSHEYTALVYDLKVGPSWDARISLTLVRLSLTIVKS